jgi:hypothetical protein
LRKILLSLLALSPLVMGVGLAVNAEEISASNNKQPLENNIKEANHRLDKDLLKNMDAYTKDENENDGLNVTAGFEPVYSKAIPNPLQQRDSSLITTLGAGTWDYLGYDYINTKASKIVSSGGGDFMFIIDQPYIGPGFKWVYKVMEDDGAAGDDTVGYYTLDNISDPQAIIINAANYVDGSDGKAEFYIYKTTVPTATVYVEFYD